LISYELEAVAADLRDWAIHKAFPLWADAGFDHQHGRFEERLSLRAERIPGAPVRLMVQARQIYSYALAARREWHPNSQSLIEESYASMVRDFYSRDDLGGWIYSIRRDGTIAEARRDLYAHAFVLLAIASYVAATGKREALALADETLAFVDRQMNAPQGGGYLDAWPPVDAIRRQNPHMHMFEALLSLWSSSGAARYLVRAEALFSLFQTRFFLPESGVLCEYFNAALEPAEGTAGKLVEPGHHYEWIWLLRRFERASGHSVQAYVDALYMHADTHGYDRDGLIVDEVLIDGSHRTRSRRTWPVTEALKANVTEAERGREKAAGKATALAELLRRYFLTSNPSGGWIDRLDEKGSPAIDFMPASTLYHVICAIDELDHFVSGR
jgi:mannose/cellobiose epimerase-like protein (N-acyl-D-glucosamine 2-epimerase family)